jgi:hypothetical protein
VLQAMGLGGWMYDGLDALSALGGSGDPRAPGLGFVADHDDRWALPNVTGLPGTVPTAQVLVYLQAQHIDTDFYDQLFAPSAYLPTHTAHQARWHGQ